MTALVWDAAGTKTYEAGISKGVLYLSDGSGVPWNGLTSVDEKPVGFTTQPLYFEGIKYNEIVNIGDWSATLKAYTYPDEFLEYEGVVEIDNGLFVGGQDTQLFGLCYRSEIGNDLNQEAGYKLHILSNLNAVPAPPSYRSHSPNVNINEFEWTLTAIPQRIEGFRPTAELIFDTTKSSPEFTAELEAILYGTDSTSARLPYLEEIVNFADAWVP